MAVLAETLSDRGVRERRVALRDRVLVAMRYGGGVTDGEALCVELPALGDLNSELWVASSPVKRGEHHGVAWATDGEIAAAWIDADDVLGDLEGSTAEAYRGLFATLDMLGCSNPLRIWNHVPSIHRVESGLEAYKRFCRARSRVFEEAHGVAFTRRLPAASAVGSDGTRLAILVLAGRQPAEHLENPRQTRAYEYPPVYGPRSPSFARATRLVGKRASVVFLSGTASIVGHETRHLGDLERQMGETLLNLSVVRARARARRQGFGVPASLEGLVAVKVYLRRAADLERVRSLLATRFGAAFADRALYLRADLCREDLLVEIEGVSMDASDPSAV